MSLDRLINLAERTGDRLIVHNLTEDHDAVIMSIDEYENLIDGRRDVRGLSGGQMLDQINRDISVWRSNKEQDEEWERTMELEDEIIDEEIADAPFTAPWDEPWHRAGEILEDRYGFGAAENDFDEDDFDEDDEDDDEDSWTMPEMDFPDDEKEEGIGFPFDDEIKAEDIPFGPPALMADSGAWQEESLPSEEPVFYEEPV